MLQRIRNQYEHTIYASYLGYITQAIVNNFLPLLFITLSGVFNLSLQKITLLTTVNFLIQLLVDALCSRYIDRIGYRVTIIAAHWCAALGLIGVAVLPSVLGDPFTGLLISVSIYAIGGGIIEVLISPIVEACPTKKKEAAMSLLHSFYCWGHVFLVLVSTLFFRLFSIDNWRILACLWAIIPLFNSFYFAIVPLYSVTGEHKKMSIRGLLKQKVFWLILIMMVAAGASEQSMSQWASAFAEIGLKVPKMIGDLAGPTAFAFFMGTARALYGKYSDHIPLKTVMRLSALLCIGCYLLAIFSKNQILGLLGCSLCGFTVGIFWPGTFSLAALKLPGGGTAMYALLALAGDAGCSAGPTLVGMVADATGDTLNNGLMAALIFPVLILLGMSLLREKELISQVRRK